MSYFSFYGNQVVVRGSINKISSAEELLSTELFSEILKKYIAFFLALCYIGSAFLPASI